MRPSRATWVGLAIVLASCVAKVVLAARFPVVPVSDFNAVVLFADLFAHKGYFTGGWMWDLISPGSSMALSVPMMVTGGDPATVARWTTVLMNCALPLLPLLLLRNVVGDRARLVATALVALLPAQIVFSGVPAQDSWVQLPIVALACLAIRNGRGIGRGSPAWAAALYGAAVLTRPEMLLVALPIALVAAWPRRMPARRVQCAVLFVAVSIVALGAIAVQRGNATGHYALSTKHGGVSMLGAYVPGAGFDWQDPADWVAITNPALAIDAPRLREEAGALALQEIEKRPVFHAQRRVGAVLWAATGADGTLTYWTLADVAQAPANVQAAGRLAVRAEPVLRWSLVALHALFIGALVVVVRRRDPVLLAITATIAIKVAVHVVFPSQARFFLVVCSLEALVIGLAWADAEFDGMLRRQARIGAIVGAVMLGAVHLALPAWRANLDDASPNQSFAVRHPAFDGVCTLHRGKLLHAGKGGFGFQVINADPVPGETARIECHLQPNGDGGMFRLEVNDAYAPGGFPDRLVQEAWVDGAPVLEHDIARDAGAQWWSHSLAIRRGQSMDVVVQIRAVQPDAGPAWGNAAATEVRFAASPGVK